MQSALIRRVIYMGRKMVLMWYQESLCDVQYDSNDVDYDAII